MYKPKFESYKDLEARIEEFFNYCKDYDKPITITRLSNFLGVNRLTLLKYRNNKELDWLITLDNEERIKIKELLDYTCNIVEEYYEDNLFNRNTFNGSKFSLINNYNWKDKQEIESSNTNQNLDLSGISLEDLKKLVDD